MINRIRESIFSKLLWGFMGLFLLNISVDTADPNPEHIPEDLSFNDQESFIEIIVEQVFGYEDAFAEYDDHDTEDQNKKKNVKIDLLTCSIVSDENDQTVFPVKKNTHPSYEAQLITGFMESDYPPPKA